MTTIAWDGYVLSADTMMSHGNSIIPTQKVFVDTVLAQGSWDSIRKYIVAGTGTMEAVSVMREWLANGMLRDKLPAFQNDEDKACQLLVVTVDYSFTVGIYGGVLRFPLSQRLAFGSGRDFATAAMRLGRSSRDAVELAIQLDAHTGGEAFGMSLYDIGFHDNEPGDGVPF